MSAEQTPESCPYTLGETYARKETPTFEFKAGATGYTGGGYSRIRSRERRPHTPGDGTDDVFVSVHRLAAVVWCYDADEPLADVLADLSERDVHHQLEMPSANLPGAVEVLDHGDHASRTNGSPSRTQVRTWFEDAKRERQQPDDTPEDACAECGAEAKGEVAGARYCLEHATDAAEQTGQAVELL